MVEQSYHLIWASLPPDDKDLSQATYTSCYLSPATPVSALHDNTVSLTSSVLGFRALELHYKVQTMPNWSLTSEIKTQRLCSLFLRGIYEGEKLPS